MPNRISASPSSLQKLSHDPTKMINGDPMGFMGSNPYGDMTADIIFGAVNTLLGWIDDATGLNLLGLAQTVESLVTPEQFGNLLSALVGGGVASIGDVGAYFANAFAGVDMSVPGAIVNAIGLAIQHLLETVIQQIQDGIVSVATGFQSFGNDIQAVAQALFYPLQLASAVPNLLGTLVTNVQADLAALSGQTQVHQANIAALQTALSATLPAGTDKFDRASIGTNWTNVLGTLSITNSLFVNGLVQTVATAAGYYALVPDTDRVACTIRIDNQLEGVARGIICADTGFTNYAAVELVVGKWGNNQVRIVTGSGPNFVVPQAGVDYPGYQFYNGTALEIRYDPVANQYFVLKDGQPIGLDWVDSNNVVTHGAARRHGGILTNALNNNYPFCGPGITEFSLRGW